MLNAGEYVSHKHGSSWRALINSSISRSVNLRRSIAVLAALAGVSAIIIPGSLTKKMYARGPFQTVDHVRDHTHTLPAKLQISPKKKISHWLYWNFLLHINTSSSVRKHLDQMLCFIHFFQSQTFSEKRLSSSVNSIAAKTLLLTFTLHSR